MISIGFFIAILRTGTTVATAATTNVSRNKLKIGNPQILNADKLHIALYQWQAIVTMIAESKKFAAAITPLSHRQICVTLPALAPIARRIASSLFLASILTLKKFSKRVSAVSCSPPRF